MSNIFKKVYTAFNENTFVLIMILGILIMAPFAMRPTEAQFNRNCEYFQSRMTALRECATLPGCTVTSDEFAYTATREKKWCKK